MRESSDQRCSASWDSMRARAGASGRHAIDDACASAQYNGLNIRRSRRWARRMLLERSQPGRSRLRWPAAAAAAAPGLTSRTAPSACSALWRSLASSWERLCTCTLSSCRIWHVAQLSESDRVLSNKQYWLHLVYSIAPKFKQPHCLASSHQVMLRGP